MFTKNKDGNYTGEIRVNFEPDNLVSCLARIINERQDWGNTHGITLYFPGDILHDMEFIKAGNSNEYILQVCEFGTQISKEEDWDRAAAQWKSYTNGHKLVGIFLLRKEDGKWRIEEIDINNFLNRIKENK